MYVRTCLYLFITSSNPNCFIIATRRCSEDHQVRERERVLDFCFIPSCHIKFSWWSFSRFTYRNLVTTFTSSSHTSWNVFAIAPTRGNHAPTRSLALPSVVATGGVFKGKVRIHGKLHHPPLQGIPRWCATIATHNPKDANSKNI